MISKNKFSQKLISIAGLSLIYFWSRIQNLTAIPIFGDEAIYIRWSQIIKNVETLRFIPLTDGKQPLFMWAMVPLFKFFSDPLVAGRFLSILSGFGSLVTLLFLSSIILNYSSSKTNQPHLFVWQSINRFFYPSLVSSLIYLCLPFTFFFDRLATADSLLSFLGLLSFFTSLLLAKFPRLDLSLILGIVLGLAWITKSPAIYFIVLSILSFVIITKKLKLIYYPLISATISFCIYNLLRLGPQFHMIGIRNKDYVWSISDILKHPLDPLKPHLIDIFNISSLFISIPVIALFFTCLYLFIKQKQKLTIFIVTLFWSILPLIANASFAKVFTARYILFTIPYLILIGTIAIASLPKNGHSLWPLILLAFVPNLIYIRQLSITPFTVKLPPTESGYTTDWTSGWGIKPAADYLITKAQTKNVIVGTEGNFGTLPDGLQIYTDSIPNLTIIGQGLGFTQIPPQLVDANLAGDDVYLLINQSRNMLNIDQLQKLTLIASYPKPGSDYLQLYQLKP